VAPWIYIEDLKKHIGEEVTLKGWLYNMRSSKKIRFLEVRDGTGIVQCVMGAGDVPAGVFESTGGISRESSIIVTGIVKEDARSKIGVEIGLTGLELVAKAQPYPIAKKSHGPAFLLDHRHLWIRSRKQVALLRIRHEVIRTLRGYFDKRGYVCFDPPIFTANACEGTSTLFQTDYFGKTAYLSQSGQLYGEAGALALGRIYTFGPTFRAEKSKTRRHLTEFWMMEPEIAYLDIEGVMELVEDMLVELVAVILDKRAEELKVLERDTSLLEKVRKPFPRVHYKDAAAKLTKMNDRFKVPFEDGDDFGAEHETELTKSYEKPIFVHRFPAEIKAFYMKRDKDDPQASLSVDCLAPEGYGEIVGGGEREDDLDALLKRLGEHSLPKEAFDWYIDLRKYGSVPHSGFGLGLERTISWIAGIHHLREAIPFPRTIERLTP